MDNENLSVSLVEHGFATMHHTAETSEYGRVLKAAEENAVRRRIGVWSDFVEKDAEAEERQAAPSVDRTLKYEKVLLC